MLRMAETKQLLHIADILEYVDFAPSTIAMLLLLPSLPGCAPSLEYRCSTKVM